MAAKAAKKKPDTDTKTPVQKTKKPGTKKATAKTAASRTSSSTKKRSSSSSGNAAVVSKKQEVIHAAEPATKRRLLSPFAKEATLPILWALCAFLFFSYFGFGGYIGDFLTNLSFGLFGTLAYLLPNLLCICIRFSGFKPREATTPYSKTLAGTVPYFTVCSFLWDLASSVLLLRSKDSRHLSVLRKRQNRRRSGQRRNLPPAYPGVRINRNRYFSDHSAALLCLLLITQRSLLKWLRRYLKEVYTASARHHAQWREEREASENTFSNFPDQTQLQVERKTVNTRRANRRECENQVFSGRTNRSGTQRRKSGTAAAEGTDSARSDVRIEQRNVTPSLIVETAERPSARTAASAPADSAAGRKADPVSAAHAVTEMPQDSSLSTQPSRTDIDIPIHFPATPRQRRQDHKVTGVTLDTRITGDPAAVGSDVREILSPRASLGAEEEPVAGMQTKERVKPDLRYINLDSDGDDSDLPDDFLSQLQDFPFQEAADHRQSTVDDSSVRELSGTAFDELDFDASADKADDSIHMCQSNAFSAENADVHPAHPEPDAVSAVSMEDDDSFLSASDAADFGSADENISDDFFLSDEEAKLRASTSSGHVFTQSVKEISRDTTRSAPSTRSITAESAAEEGSEHSARRNPRSSAQEIQDGIEGVKQAAAKTAETVRKEYIFPPIDLLKPGQTNSGNDQDQEVKRTAAKLQQTLNSFGVHATVTNYSCGPNVTRYELLPQQGVKVSKIVASYR